MTEALLTIKLFAPPLRPGLVSRPRLVKKLNQALEQGSRLTLFSAPAGYGKTTLALEWLANLSWPYAWLSLDRTDNHPVQFLSYLVAALQKLEEKNPEIFPSHLEHFQVRNPEEVQSKLTVFLNQIAAASAPFVLVLDDYHTITDLGVHQALEFLIDHQPPGMHLVITTRQDPLLPLSRLRSRGQVTEIRLSDLRFTPEEAAAFLNGTMRLNLIDEQIASLESRTEGWIAGLQLAALSLSDIATSEPASADLEAAPPASIMNQEQSDFIQNFTGDDRHVMDYLLDEVLSRQPEEVQRFLLRTSILKRLCATLCNAILNQEPPGKEAGDSRAILEYLDHANLFIIPLDNRRQWYRYHHLFADLLSSRLQTSDPDLVRLLHCQASQWYEQEGLTAVAVDHALLAEDFDRALSLIEHTARSSIWASGDLPALLNWSKRLPEEVILTRPRLCIYNARGLFFIGQIEAAEKTLQSAEKALQAREKPDKFQDELWGLLCTNQATFAAMQGDPKTALDLAEQAEERVPLADLSSHARIAHARGVAHYFLGSVQDARLAYMHAVQLCQQANNRNLGLDAIACLAITEILAGRLKEAHRLCEEPFAADPAIRQAPPATTLYLALAEILYEQNDLPGAIQTLETCLRLGEKLSWTHVIWQAYALQSQILLAQKNRTAALAAIHQAEQIAGRYHNPYINRLIAAHQARIDLATGDYDAAARWADSYQRQAPIEGLQDMEALTFADILLSSGKSQEAMKVVDRLLESANQAGRDRTVLYASVLKGRIQGNGSFPSYDNRRGCPSEVLKDAFLQGEREGFVRVFQEAGLPPSSVEKSGVQSNASPLIEPLSERELEVMGLIAQGLSNPEIAARLYLSVNTLRAHTTNIYQKLDVHSRIQAVTRARQLGLLPEK